MKLTEDQKTNVFNQITQFNNQTLGKISPNKVLNDKKTGSSLPEGLFYMADEHAEKAASFFGLICKSQKSTMKIIDLCFGSGSLTSHLLLENNLDIDRVIFNDIITTVTNQELQIDNVSKITSYDISQDDLVENLVKDLPFNLLIFNPQFGGGYADGRLDDHLDVTEKKSIKITDNILNFLIEKGFDENDLTINEKKRSILIKYEGKKPTNLLGPIKSINYYDIILKRKGDDQTEHLSQKLSQLKKNIQGLLSDDHTIVFYGKKQHFQLFFKDYKWIRQLLPSNSSLPSVFIAKEGGKEKDWECYKKNGKNFTKIDERQFAGSADIDTSRNIEDLITEIEGSRDKIIKVINKNPLGLGPTSAIQSSEPKSSSCTQDSYKFTSQAKGNLNFSIKNLLLKGVPGTGKSRLIDQIIEHKLNIPKIHHELNILRINIHSGSSNSDLMQGIGLMAQNEQIAYREKQGLIFDLIIRACASPQQPFVLVLEEIQENSLNELIGDLIYLIDEEKRAKLNDALPDKNYSSQEIIDAHIEAKKGEIRYVSIPNLVSAGTEYRKMIMPDNLYIFCTSNYRDDKKIIEDNLLRRFDTLDVFPNASLIKDDKTKAFFQALNDSILKVLAEEVHPDRFEIGHATWMKVHSDNNEAFAKALYKTIIELKEIREIQSSDLITILNEIKDVMGDESNEITLILDKFNSKNLIEFIKHLQQSAYPELLKLVEGTSHIVASNDHSDSGLPPEGNETESDAEIIPSSDSDGESNG